jgi:hypothetical protein
MSREDTISYPPYANEAMSYESVRKNEKPFLK